MCFRVREVYNLDSGAKFWISGRTPGFYFPPKTTSQKYIPGGLMKSGQIAKRVFKKWIYGGHHASIHYYQKVIDRLISGFPEYGFIWLHGDPKYVRKYLAANITVYIPRGLIFRGDDAFRLLFSQEFRLLFSQELALLFFCTLWFFFFGFLVQKIT